MRRHVRALGDPKQPQARTHSRVDGVPETQVARTPGGGQGEGKHGGASVVVACIQTWSDLGDVIGNRSRLEGLTREAARKGAKFVVFPEAAVTGYTSQDLTQSWHITGRKLGKSPRGNGNELFEGKDLEGFAESVPGPSSAFFARLSKELGIYIAVPLIERTERSKESKQADYSFFKPHPWTYFNTCVLVGPCGRVLLHYRKNNLWPGVDHAWCTAGTQISAVDTPYGRVGLAICFDVHTMFKRYAEEDALWTLLYPVAWVDQDADQWFSVELPEHIRTVAGNYNVCAANWSVATEQLGNDWRGYGFSRVFGAQGDIRAQATSFTGSEIVYASLPFSAPSVSSSSCLPSPAISLASAPSLPSAPSPLKIASPEPKLTQPIDCLSDPRSDPPWTRRRQPYRARFLTPYTHTLLGCGHQFLIKQGGGAETLGMTVWDAALVLSAYLDRSCRAVLPGLNVLELGSGTGLLGLVCKHLGAKSVILTDVNDGALIAQLSENARANASLTATPCSQTMEKIGRAVGERTGTDTQRRRRVKRGKRTRRVQVPPKLAKVTTEHVTGPVKATQLPVVTLDWTVPILPRIVRTGSPPDLVLCADLLSSVELVGPLVDTLARLCGPRTKVLFAFEVHKLDSVKRFFLQAERLCFDIARVPASCLHPQFRCGGIQVVWMHCRRRRRSAGS